MALSDTHLVCSMETYLSISLAGLVFTDTEEGKNRIKIFTYQSFLVRTMIKIKRCKRNGVRFSVVFAICSLLKYELKLQDLFVPLRAFSIGYFSNKVDFLKVKMTFFPLFLTFAFALT